MKEKNVTELDNNAGKLILVVVLWLGCSALLFNLLNDSGHAIIGFVFELSTLLLLLSMVQVSRKNAFYFMVMGFVNLAIFGLIYFQVSHNDTRLTIDEIKNLSPYEKERINKGEVCVFNRNTHVYNWSLSDGNPYTYGMIKDFENCIKSANVMREDADKKSQDKKLLEQQKQEAGLTSK